MSNLQEQGDLPLIFDRDLVRWRRNRSAASPKDVGYLLDRMVEEFAERLAFIQRNFERVLILGAHDGRVARQLSQHVPDAHITQVDHAETLLEDAHGKRLVCDEEALPFEADTFDCVIAPLTLQYVNDLPGVFVQLNRLLKPDGLLLGAVLGGRTLEELADAMLTAEAEVRGSASMRVMPKIDVRQLGSLLQRAAFALPVVDSDVVAVTYPTPLHLMRELKAMGASNSLVARSRVPMTRGLLMRAVEIYSEQYGTPDGRVTATFEFLILTGWTPHPNQQKPLRPGSATHRLADALNTVEQSAGDRPDHPVGGDDD